MKARLIFVFTTLIIGKTLSDQSPYSVAMQMSRETVINLLNDQTVAEKSDDADDDVKDH